MTIVAQEYIEIDGRGVAGLAGSRIKVQDLVACQRVNELTTEQLIAEFPELGPARVHAALAYYHDHTDLIDAEIEEGTRYADEMRAKNPNRFTREELRARWHERCPDRPFPGDVAAGND